MTKAEYERILVVLERMREDVCRWYKRLAKDRKADENLLPQIPKWTAGNYKYEKVNAEKSISTLIMTLNDCFLKKIYIAITQSEPPLPTWNIIDRGIIAEINITEQLLESIMHLSETAKKSLFLPQNANTRHIIMVLEALWYYIAYNAIGKYRCNKQSMRTDLQ